MRDPANAIGTVVRRGHRGPGPGAAGGDAQLLTEPAAIGLLAAYTALVVAAAAALFRQRDLAT